MKKLQKISVFAFLTAAIFSCSTKKDAFLNRNYHALTTKYNVLFNGEQAYQKGLKAIREQHQDNFWKRLQIEPITFDEREAIKIPRFKDESKSGLGLGLGIGFGGDKKQEGVKNQTPFERSEEKAVKAIQKHSMNIRGREKNHQIDDAYLLLGKSRYYTQRFIPSVDAFNYIIEHYPYASLINETKVWRAKANIRLENLSLAVESLKYLLDIKENEEQLTAAIREKAHTALAMAYEKMDSIDKVKEHLIKSAVTFEDRDQIARNLFVLGQIYAEENKKDSARLVFQRIADFKKFPDKYRIHSNIALAKNTEDDSTSVVLIKRFKNLIRDIDNRKYLDELYYQVGFLEENRDSINDAVKYYKKSLEAKNGSEYQKTFTYEKLGNIYFDQQNYLIAGAYYDSVAQVVPKMYENEKRIRRIKRKNRGLTSLKKYETIVKNNDSILGLVAMSEDERKVYFEKYIEKLKEAEDIKRQLALQNAGNQFGGGASFLNNKNKDKWYFYNTEALQFGKAEFEKVWGKRKLEDNWRLADKTTLNTETAEDGSLATESRYEIDSYLKKIPTKESVIDSLFLQRNDALYQLGLTYKEQFRNTQLATNNLERLLDVNTNNDLILPINYHLYQIYNETKNSSKASVHKNVILTQFPDSKFAQIVRNPNKKLTQETQEDKIAETYKEVFYLYKEDKFDEVISKIDIVLPSVEKSPMYPKFELLKAYAIGKSKDKESYKKALEFVALRFANTEEGKKAQEIVQLLKK